MSETARVVTAEETEVGFQLGSDPDTVRAPDIAFIRGDRVLPGFRCRVCEIFE